MKKIENNMKAQNSLFLVFVFGLIVALMFAYIYVNSFNPSFPKGIHDVEIENRIKLSVANLENIHDQTIGMSYLELLAYVVDNGSTKFCVTPSNCVNISKLLTSYFNTYFGHNWNLTIYVKPPSLKGWIIKMFVVTGNSNDYDVCAYDPPKDEKGKNWWEYNYNDSFFIKNWKNISKDGHLYKGTGWVTVSAPFHEDKSCDQWGLPSLYKGECTYTAVKNGICIPIYKVLKKYTTTVASVYCPNTEWNIYTNFIWGWCSNNRNYQCLWHRNIPIIVRNYLNLPKFYAAREYFKNPPLYKTATDITLLAKELRLIDNLDSVVGSFYRGKVKILPYCKRVYLEVLWHEVVRLYISYINKHRIPISRFLLVAPECKEFSKDGTGTHGYILGFINSGSCKYNNGEIVINITKWVINDRDPKNNTIVIANAYWDPHIGSNGISMVRVYCFDKDGRKYELNDYFYMNKPKHGAIYLGYKLPKTGNIYSFKIWVPVEGSTIPVWYAILRVW